MWTTFFKSLPILASSNYRDLERIIRYHNKISLCYIKIHSTVEPLIFVGISFMFWLIVLGLTLFIRIEEYLPQFVVFWGILCIVSGVYSFVSAMGFVAGSNEMSQKVLHTCSNKIRNCSKSARERKILRKQVLSCRSLQIPYRPLGAIDRAIQMDFVDTMKTRVVDLLVIQI